MTREQNAAGVCRGNRVKLKREHVETDLDLDNVAESIHLLFLGLPLQLLSLAGCLNLTLECQLAICHHPLSGTQGICELCSTKQAEYQCDC